MTNARIWMNQLIHMHFMKILKCPTVNIWGRYQLSVSVSMIEYHLHPYQPIGDNRHPSWIRPLKALPFKSNCNHEFQTWYQDHITRGSVSSSECDFIKTAIKVSTSSSSGSQGQAYLNASWVSKSMSENPNDYTIRMPVYRLNVMLT